MAGKYMDQRNGNGQPIVPSPGSPGSTNGDLPVPNHGASGPDTVSPGVQDPANQADEMTGTTGSEGSMSPQPLQGNPNGIQPINDASSIAPIQDPNVNSNGVGVPGVANPMQSGQGSPAPAAIAVVGMKHADTATSNQGYLVENTVGGQTHSNPPVSPQNPSVGAAPGGQTYNNPPAPAQNSPVGNNGGVSGQSNLPPSVATPPGGTTVGGSAMVEPIAQAQVGSSVNWGGGSGFVDPVAQVQAGSNPNAGGGSAIVDPVAQTQAQAQANANAPGGAGNGMIAGTAKPTQPAGTIPAKPVATGQERSGGLQKRVYTPETPSSIGTGTGLGESDAASLPGTTVLGSETQLASGAMTPNDRLAGVGASVDQENVLSSPTAVPFAGGHGFNRKKVPQAHSVHRLGRANHSIRTLVATILRRASKSNMVRVAMAQTPKIQACLCHQMSLVQVQSLLQTRAMGMNQTTWAQLIQWATTRNTNPILQVELTAKVLTLD